MDYDYRSLTDAELQTVTQSADVFEELFVALDKHLARAVNPALAARARADAARAARAGMAHLQTAIMAEFAPHAERATLEILRRRSERQGGQS